MAVPVFAAAAIAAGIAAISSASDSYRKDSDPTIIYRWGNGNNTNLTPRLADMSGLSYSTVLPASGPYTVTTIEAINATGQLVAIKDGFSHVSVTAVSTTKMLEWIESRPNAATTPHEFTLLLQALSVRFN